MGSVAALGGSGALGPTSPPAAADWFPETDVGFAGVIDVGLAGGILPPWNTPGFHPPKAGGEAALAQSAFVWPGKVPDPNFPYELYSRTPVRVATEEEEGARPGVGVPEPGWVKLCKFCRRHDAQT